MGCNPTRLLCPCDSPGKNTGVGCHALLQGIFLIQWWNLCLLHWQADSLPLSYLGSPYNNVKQCKYFCVGTSHFIHWECVCLCVSVNVCRVVLSEELCNLWVLGHITLGRSVLTLVHSTGLSEWAERAGSFVVCLWRDHDAALLLGALCDLLWAALPCLFWE